MHAKEMHAKDTGKPTAAAAATATTTEDPTTEETTNTTAAGSGHHTPHKHTAPHTNHTPHGHLTLHGHPDPRNSHARSTPSHGTTHSDSEAKAAIVEDQKSPDTICNCQMI